MKMKVEAKRAEVPRTQDKDETEQNKKVRFCEDEQRRSVIKREKVKAGQGKVKATYKKATTKKNAKENSMDTDGRELGGHECNRE